MISHFMGIEQIHDQQAIKDVYEQVRASDDTPGELTQDEKTELFSQYEIECRDIQSQTCSDLQELQQVMGVFEESGKLSPEEIMLLQKIIKTSDDGIFGPGTFTSLTKFKSKVGAEFSLKSLVDTYNFFTSLSKEERQELQADGGKDGVFGPNTFKYMISQGTIIGDSIAGTEEEILREESQRNVQDGEPQVIDAVVSEADGISGDHHPDIFISSENINVLTNNEKIEKFIGEADSMHSVLIEFLQAAVSTGVDGDFGPNSARAVIARHPDAQSLEEVMHLEGIPMSSDGVLPIQENTPEGKREVFREMYGEYVDILEDNLNLPTGLIESIIRQETKHGTYGGLISGSGCKGMMQLSRKSIQDMLTQYRGNIRNYRESFQNLDLDRLMSLSVGETGSTILESIPRPIVETLYMLNNPDTSTGDYNSAIQRLEDFIKDDNSYFNHAVNMILGSIYLSGTYYDNTRGHGGMQDVTTTADLYNASAGERVQYRKNVSDFFDEYNQE